MLLASPGVLLANNDTIDFEPGVIAEKLSAGETVLVDYAASWCGTCKRQERVIQGLRASNPDFDKHISFVRVDWDTYRSHEISVWHNIPRRSTLLLLRGEEELGRIVAGTSKDAIESLLMLGLPHSSASSM